VAGWLHTEISVRHRELNLDTVAYLSTNRARRRLTSLIEANALTTTPDHQTLATSQFLTQVAYLHIVLYCTPTLNRNRSRPSCVCPMVVSEQLTPRESWHLSTVSFSSVTICNTRKT